MGSRERKRTERQKRKRRSAERTVPTGNGEAASTEGTSDGFQERMSRRSEERNEAARAKLEPLEQGERPRAVTVAAIVSGVMTLVFVSSAVLAAAGVGVSGRDPRPAPIAFFALILGVMTWGLWKARYWAVLGFQMLLVLVLLASALGLVQVSTVAEAVATVSLLAASGALFYFMIRAMARIQMPEPPGR
jgi:hypothetical protein